MLKKYILALSLTTALSLPLQAGATTLADSVAEALQTHPTMQAKKSGEAAAKDFVREQKSAYFPVLSVNARAGRINEDDDTTRAATGGSATSWLGEGSATLTQPLFTGFETPNRIAAAKSRLDAAGFDRTGSAEDIALKAAKAHLNLMRTRALLKLATEYVSSIEERQNSIGLMVKEGASDEAELLQANEVLMAVKTTRLGYEEAYRQAEADYIEVVGNKPDSNLDLGTDGWTPIIPQTVDAAISLASVDNPNVKSADSLVTALGQESQVARGDLYPKVDAEVSYLSLDQHEELGGELKSAQAMVKMQWNFATGGAQFAHIDKSLDQRREAQAKRDAARRMVEHDVREKFTSMQIVDQQLGLMTEREDAASQIVANYMNQFEGGKQTNLQLISANSRWFEAKAARTDAGFRQLLSRFELLSAMGRLRNAFALPSMMPAVTAKR